MHEVLVNRLGGLSLPRKSVVRLTDRPDMTLDVYCGRKTTMQQQQQSQLSKKTSKLNFKDKYSLLYSTHPQSLLVLWPCYVITCVRWIISFEEM